MNKIDTSPKLQATLGRSRDTFSRSYCLTLQGTSSVLDGTIMATPNDERPFAEQVEANLAEINERRDKLGLEGVSLSAHFR